MNGVTQPVWTYELSAGAINIDETFGLTIISMTLVSGIGSVTGGLSLQNGVASTPINLTIGQPLTIPSKNGVVLDQIVISTTGIISIIGFQ